jgi:hypothetical protein
MKKADGLENCKACGKEFIPLHHKAKTCSEECKAANSKRIKTEYYIRNKPLVISRSKESRLKNPDRYKPKVKNRDNPTAKYYKKYYTKNKDKVLKKSRELAATPARKLYMKEYRKANRKKCLSYYRNYKMRNPDVAKNGHLRRKFNITKETYDLMLTAQNGVCAICLCPETRTHHKTGKLKDLSVDHCHTTGKIRGLLCFSCNSSLGKFKDCIETLQRAIQYLTKSRED